MGTHAAIPHFHGDDMYATFAHIASHSVIAGIDHSDCDHDGDTEKRPASEHCVLNDTIAALACRYDHSSSEIMKAMLIQAILPETILYGFRRNSRTRNILCIQSPLKEDPALSAVAMRRAPLLYKLKHTFSINPFNSIFNHSRSPYPFADYRLRS